jgi:hypothetical protein
MRRTLLVLAAVLFGGCAGAIGDGDQPGGGGGGPGDPPAGPGGAGSRPPGGGAVTPGDPSAAGPLPLRRLDRREYNNTIRDLLGDASRPADRFPPDVDGDFSFRRAGLVSSQDYATIRDAAEALAAAAEKNVATLAPCSGDEEACARSFITGFGLRAYRRPLTAREVDSLLQLYREGRTGLQLDHAGGVRLLVEGMLQAPAFLYHWESGPAAPAMEGKLVRLSPYQNASQLSYFLWGTMPDAALFEAAAANKLGTQAELEGQARRMLADPRARDTVSEFVTEWLGLDQVAERPKDPAVYPEFKDDLKAAMAAEANAFVGNVVFDGDGKLSTLLTATFSFVNQPLAAVYGVKGVQGAALKESMLDPGQRAGLLTQAGFLTVTGSTDGSHPVKRGKKVYERLLCGELPPPPGDVPPPKPASAGGTTRERFAEHGANDCARGCHGLIDPIGFAFEHYDGIGKYRTMDNGGPVDASGRYELDGQQRSFADARELAQLLAGSDTVKRCFATQWARFAWKRLETDADRGSVEAITAAFGKAGNNVRDLLVGVTGSRSFRYRTPAAGEVLQ